MGIEGKYPYKELKGISEGIEELSKAIDKERMLKTLLLDLGRLQCQAYLALRQPNLYQAFK